MRPFCVLVIAAFLSLVSFQCGAQGTAFTYQGRLNASDTAANGAYDFQFVLFDVSQFGFPVGPLLTNTNVAVNNGVFTTALDLGAGIFMGRNYWLEIYVRTNGNGSFTLLTPRQPITPTPYALFAQKIASGGVAGTHPNAVTFNNPANSFSGAFVGNGAGVSNVNAATLNGLSSSNFWKLGGNAGANPMNGNFIGTTDNQALELRVNGHRALRLQPNVFGGPSVVGGSNTVHALSPAASIAGGQGNDIREGGFYSAIGGGWNNVIDGGQYSLIAGGLRNRIQLGVLGSVIGGGWENNIEQNVGSSVIGGGHTNSLASLVEFSVIGGGEWNRIHPTNTHTVIAGGGFNEVHTHGDSSVISGGRGNVVGSNAAYAVIPGGFANFAGGAFSFAAGNQAKASHSGAFVWADNQSNPFVSTTNDQFSVRAAGGVRFITGGAGLTVDGVPASRETIIPDDLNFSNAVNVLHGSTVNYIASNVVGGTISGGGVGYSVFVPESGPLGNSVSNSFGTVGGGVFNRNGGSSSAIGGGESNETLGNWAAIAGGLANRAAGAAAVGGGYFNYAAGFAAVVPGGQNNAAAGVASFAAGYRAKANHDGSFVWSDRQGGDFTSTAEDQFLIRAAGGVGINGNVSLQGGYRRLELSGGNSSGFLYGSYPYFGDGVHVGYNFYADGSGSPHVINAGGGSSRMTAGYGEVVLAVGPVGFGPNTVRLIANLSGVSVYGTFNNNSDRNAKQDFEPVSTSQILEKVTRLPISKWSYKDDASTRHIGPVAQDFHSAFQIGTDEKHIAPLDEAGVALAAIQGLNQKLAEELKRRDEQNAELKRELAKIKNIVQELMRRLHHEPEQQPLVHSFNQCTFCQRGGRGH